MSSNQYSNEKQKEKSIRGKLTRRVIYQKISIKFWMNVLMVLLMIVTFLGATEYLKTGNIDLIARNRSLKFVEMQLSDSMFIPEGVNVVAPVLKYSLFNANTGAELLAIELFDLEIAGLGIVFGLHIIQATFALIGYGIEDKKTRKILKPLTEMSARLEEFSKLEFTEEKYHLPEEKYHLIEEKISNLNPEEEIRFSSGDKELFGIEIAMNNLLRRIRESNKQQARFVNDASHELRTPIAVIEGYANMLDRWGKEDEKILEESIAAIKNESANMKHLVEQLLFLARGDAGRTAVNISRVSLNSLMQEVYEESLMIDENHIYKWMPADTDIFVDADEGLIKQAVRILVDNAAKYTKEKDDIILRTGAGSNNEVFLQVQDSGIGMKEADVEHMFERFYRADEARSFDGTGLGLSIAKWIVDKHQGHFEIVSREELGTRINIFLPVSKLPADGELEVVEGEIV